VEEVAGSRLSYSDGTAVVELDVFSAGVLEVNARLGERHGLRHVSP
jgi:hypothetical protein